MNKERWQRGNLTAAGLVTAAVVFLAGCAGGPGGDAIGYDLPAGEDRYTLEQESGGVRTVWQYRSSRPTQDAETDLKPCLGTLLNNDEAPCRPEPLIFLDYDLGLDLDNTLPAGRAQTITITTYYEEAPSLPEVTDLGLEVSFDGGGTWQEVRTKARGSGEFTATIHHPRLSETDGAVGMRVTATDDQGNRVEQTITEAYRLR